MITPVRESLPPDEDALYEIKRIGEEWLHAMGSTDRRVERAHLALAASYIRSLLSRPGFGPPEAARTIEGSAGPRAARI